MTKSANSSGLVEAPPFLAGDGEMGARILSHDWSASSLGPPKGWPQSLLSALSICLNTPIVSAVHWGPDLISFYNDAYAPALAERHPWALGRPFGEVWSEIWDVLGPQIATVLQTGRGFSTDRQLLKMNRRGRIEDTWWVYSFAPLYGDSGIAGINVTAIDVTAAEVAEQALRESEIRTTAERDRLALVEERLQVALSAGRAIGTWDWDVPSDRVYADARFARLYGVDPGRAEAGAPIAEFFGGIHPDDVARVQAEVAAGMETGDPFRSEYRLPQPNGADRWVIAEGRCVLSSDGKPLRFSGLSFDITERKRAEIRRGALVRLTDYIRDLDDPHELSFAASEILGVTLDLCRVSYGTIDREAETLTFERDWLAPGMNSLAGTIDLREYQSFIDDLKTGETEAGAGAFIDVPVIEQGRLVAVLFLNNADARKWAKEDVALAKEIAERTRTATERLRATKSLRQANANLEAKVEERTAELAAAGEALRQSQKMEAIGQLTGGIAHDFNNLPAGLSGSLELLERRVAQGRLEGVGRYIDVAQEATRRAASLTQRLLAFARRQTLDPKVVDANRTIAGMADLLGRAVGPTVHIEVVQAGGLWGTKLDPSQLENAILNLCINARDAMAPGGGRLTIETANKWLDDRAAKERELPPGQYVSVSVSDTGAGMPAEIVEKIFDPFFTTKPIGQGTGLGLSMIYGFVRQSGGQVRVYSEVGKGTTMALYFPRFIGELSADDLPEVASLDRGHGDTVLVIDDEPAIRMVIGEVLAEIGYRVVEAADGPSGLRIIQAGGRLDLLITDVGLPNGLNGRQVADAARVINPKLKVLLITGFADNAAVGNGHLDAGMSIITKPFSNAALVNKVREIIDSV